MYPTRTVVVLVFGVFSLTAVVGDAVQCKHNDDSGVSSITDVMQDFVRARSHYDQKLLGDTISMTYTEVSPIGDIDSRIDVLDFYGEEAARKFEASGASVSSSLDEVMIDILGNTAIATARESVIAASPRGSRSFSFRASFFLEQDDHRWRVRHVQYTPIVVQKDK